MKKVALITGASRGIGAAAARRFARDGWRLILNYNQSRAEAEALAEELSAGAECFALQADISDKKQVREMVRQTKELLGEIDLLINNAGIAEQKMFQDIKEEDWNRMFSVNVTGMFHCCQAVAEDMIRRGSGNIINLSSIWGMTGASCEVHYSAAKAAVIGFTKALAKELGPSGIRVNCIAPGVILTDMNGNLSDEILEQLREETPAERLGTPEDIAGVMAFLASEEADFITGQVISPNGGFVI